MSRGVAQRFVALDGLRGLAAAVVLFHHCLLTSSLLAEPYRGEAGEKIGDLPSWVEWVTYSPLHIAWAGREAVFIFFVLSGFVLTLPFLKERRPSWLSYYPRRLLRLYLPVWVAVIFTLGTFVVVDHAIRPELSWWTVGHSAPFDIGRVTKELTLVTGIGGYNSPLWSLRWEIIFSLALPAYLWFAARTGRAWWAAAVALMLLSGYGASLDVESLQMLPMFGVGVLMAMHLRELTDGARRLPSFAWAALVVLAVLALTFSWWAVSGWLGGTVAVFGAAVAVFLFMGNGAAAAFASTRVVQWLGARSFSLYLIHVPIVVSVAMALGTDNALLVIPVAVPIALVGADLFFRLIERPSHRLSQAAGHIARRQTDDVREGAAD